MISWEQRLYSWRFPIEKVPGVADAFRKLGLDPARYKTPTSLYFELRRMNFSARREEMEAMGVWDSVVDFLKWLYEEIFKPYGSYIALILTGCVVTWLAKGWYQALGAIPIGAGVYLMLKKAGAID